MNRRRRLILLLGPAPIVLASLALSHFVRSDRAPLPLAGDALPTNAAEPLADHLLPADDSDAPGGAAHNSVVPADRKLARECQAVADALAARLGEGCEVVAHAPFVVAGDLALEELEDWHRRTIGPAARAMAASYFRVRPDRPVTVLLFASEESYNRYAKALYGEEGISVFGYYKPRERVLVMNISTGGGTLVHELTHALVDFDFPRVPDWFNEGLASLHEQCRIRDDETGIDGLENWRLPILQQAIRQGRLRSLHSLVCEDDFRGDNVGLNYAQARYFCLYLQRTGRLEDFFTRFRTAGRRDPNGEKTLAALVEPLTWDELDAEFQQWVLGLKW